MWHRKAAWPPCVGLMTTTVEAPGLPWQVKHLREQIKKNVDVEALAGGLNKRKMLEQAVCNELCNMLDPSMEPYQPKKKQPNVIMFVGLQACTATGHTHTRSNLAQRSALGRVAHKLHM